MCTNRALVDSLECYMEDLVDNFEDFVKKSLILISLGVATVVAMFLYMLKVLKDRPETPNAAAENDQNLRRCSSNTSIPTSASKSSSKRNNVRSDSVLPYDPKHICSSANQHIPATPSFEEQLLREIGYNNYNKSCELKQRFLQNIQPSRISIPSLPTSITRQHLPPPRNCVKVLKRTSCCSICCDDSKTNIPYNY